MIGRRSFLVMVSRVISAILSFVGLAFMTRYLGAEVYGTIVWTLSLVATFNAVSDLGFNAAHVKRLSEGQDASECVSTFIVSKLLLTALMVGVVLGSVAIWTVVLDQPLMDTSIDIVILFILFYLFYDIAQIAMVTFDAKMQTAKTQLCVILDPLIRVPLVVFISVNRMSAVHLAYAYALGGLAMAITAMILLSRERIRLLKPVLFKSYLIFAVPLATTAVVSTLVLNIDKILLGYFWTNAAVGFYTAGQRILDTLSVIGVGVSTLVFPAFSKMHAEGKLDILRHKTWEAERYITMLSLPAVIVIVLFPYETAIILLGGEFGAAAEPMRILCLAAFLVMVNTSYGIQMTAVDRPDVYARINIFRLLLYVALLFIFVPTSIKGFDLLGLGATGAAMSNLLSVIALFLVTRYVVFRLTETRTNPRIVLQIIAGVLTGLSLYFLSFLWEIHRWWDLLGYGLLSIGIFAGLLYLIRELTMDDIRYFLSVINPKEMRDYIVSEFRK